jgi:hypothetical protein
MLDLGEGSNFLFSPMSIVSFAFIGSSELFCILLEVIYFWATIEGVVIVKFTVLFVLLLFIEFWLFGRVALLVTFELEEVFKIY